MEEETNKEQEDGRGGRMEGNMGRINISVLC